MTVYERPFGRALEDFTIGDVYRHWPGKTITEAGVVLDPVSGKPAISMAMDNIGRRIWKEVTTQKLNKYIAITLDARVLSAPVINSVIPDGRSQISGSFSFDKSTHFA